MQMSVISAVLLIFLNMRSIFVSIAREERFIAVSTMKGFFFLC